MSRTTIALGAVACGLLAAGFLPGGPLGVGIAVVALAAAAVVAGARPARLSGHVFVCGGLALALVSMAVVRAAGWVVAIDLLAGIWLASSAVAGGRTWGGVTRGGFAVTGALARGCSFVVSPLRERARGALGGRARPVLRGLAMGLALIALFGTLFASADRAFLELADRVLAPDVQASLLPARVYLAVFVPALVGALIVIGPRFGSPLEHQDSAIAAPPEPRGLGVPEWSISLGLLNLLFGAFVAVQLTVLFGGQRHVLDTVGLTYAQYARQGFFQLVAVALLTFAVVGAGARMARVETRGHNILLRVLLGTLCLLTLVVLASALRRLSLYEEMYGLTRLRISVHAAILWFGALFTMVLVALVLWRSSWLPRSVVYVSGLGLVVFSLVNPDGLIARHNVARFDETGSIDVAYLQTLSADAVPELERLRPDLRACIYDAIGRHLDPDPSWQYLNWGRARALDEVRAAATTSTPCDPYVLSRGPRGRSPSPRVKAETDPLESRWALEAPTPMTTPGSTPPARYRGGRRSEVAMPDENQGERPEGPDSNGPPADGPGSGSSGEASETGDASQDTPGGNGSSDGKQSPN